MKPESYEADICIVRGQSDDHKSLLEKLAFSLLQATKAIAEQELSIIHRDILPEYYIFIPLIVTSADLYVCEVDPSLINIALGTIEKINPIKVPFIRFRKTLTFDFKAAQESKSLNDANKLLQHSVFVVNSNSFREFLIKWDGIRSHRNGLFPWEKARNIEMSQ
jgi:hypothetical protein